MNRENSNKLRNRNLIRKAIFRKSGIEQYYTFRVFHCASLHGKLRQEHHLSQEFKTKLGTIAIACLEKAVLNSDNGYIILRLGRWHLLCGPEDLSWVLGTLERWKGRTSSPELSSDLYVHTVMCVPAPSCTPTCTVSI